MVACWLTPLAAAPPYVTDDPEPTDTGAYEIYAFTGGSIARDHWEGAAGVDFNYGAAANLQLTAVLPVLLEVPTAGAAHAGPGNVELAAKLRVLQQSDAGLDVAIFPRIFLPAASNRVGDHDASILLPVWIQKSFNKFEVFGGGGCEIHRGGDARDFCILGVALNAQVSNRFQFGGEIYHQTADAKHGRDTTVIDIGATWDLSDRVHWLASVGPGLQHPGNTGKVVWYTSLLFTF